MNKEFSNRLAISFMKKLGSTCLILSFLGFCSPSLAVESGMYRLLSISKSEKLILVSQIPNKTKYLLDASSTKIIVNDKPAELKDLKSYSIIQLKFTLRKAKKNDIDIDGTADEIQVTNPDKTD